MTEDPAASPGEAARWLGKASEDLAVADLLLANPIGVNWAACFHAQQAAEKAIKALLVAFGIDFPRAHALERLADLLPVDVAVAFERDDLVSLSPWAVAGRYPEEIADPDSDTAAQLVRAAHGIVEAAKRAASPS